jgi:hypothetical protein
MSSSTPNPFAAKRLKQFKRDNHNKPQGATIGDIIVEVATGLFRPTTEQRIAKADFWNRYKKLSRDDRDRTPVRDITPAFVESILGTSANIANWAKSDDRFFSWFLNTNDFNNRLEALANKALSAADQILDDLDPASNGSKVALIKMLVPIMATLQEQVKPKVDLAGLLGAMDINQLKLLVSSNAGSVGVAYEAAPQLPSEEAVDV